QAMLYAAQQMEFGPRITGTEAHAQMGDWLIEELSNLGWMVYIQPYEISAENVPARNIIAVRGEGPTAILGAHYDTRMFADQDPDPDKHIEPVPGANDGASGVAVLLELARTLDVAATGKSVCL